MSDDAEFYDWRPACPKCGRLGSVSTSTIAPTSRQAISRDILRDVARCSRCGLVEYTFRPLRVLASVRPEAGQPGDET